MLNITVIGRVAKEADIRKDENGTPYAIVEITTHRTYKTADGEYITDTIPVKLYDKQVELFQRFAFPGSRIAIMGNFESNPYENSNSQYNYLIKARQMEFLSFRKQEETAEQPEEA